MENVPFLVVHPFEDRQNYQSSVFLFPHVPQQQISFSPMEEEALGLSADAIVGSLLCHLCWFEIPPCLWLVEILPLFPLVPLVPLLVQVVERKDEILSL